MVISFHFSNPHIEVDLLEVADVDESCSAQGDRSHHTNPKRALARVAWGGRTQI
jgi:hypothetical protein